MLKLIYNDLSFIVSGLLQVFILTKQEHLEVELDVLRWNEWMWSGWPLADKIGLCLKATIQ